LGVGLAVGARAFADEAPLSSNDPSQAAHAPATPVSPPLNTPAAAPAASAVSAADKAPRFVLQGASFDGATVMSPAALAPAWSSYRGKTVSLEDLRAIGRAAETLYAASGHPFVAILLKVQEVKDGVVHFDVVEGKVSDLSVLGSDPVARRQATAMLEPVVNRAPLALGDVEQAYELARQVPGLSVAGTLRQGSQAGGMDLVVAARRDEPLHGYINVNNLYADSVGPWGVLAGFDYDGRSDYGDMLSAQVYTSVPIDRQLLVRGDYERGLDAAGARFTLSGLWGTANPKDLGSTPLEIATSVANVRAEVSQPIFQRPAYNLVADVSIEGSDQQTRVFVTAPLSDDRLRIVTASLAGEISSDFGRWSGSIEVRQGLDFADASRPGDLDLSRVGGDPQATEFKASFETESATFHHVSFATRSDWQYASAPLEAPEQYAVGNLTIGRGYQPGVALADDVVAGSFEVRVGPFAMKDNLHIQPFAFYDMARLFNRGVGPYTLDSVGGGLRLQAPGKFELDLTYADPLLAPPGQPRPSPLFLVNLTASLNDIYGVIHQRLQKETGK
jgi:hemolysin activation/secretion protein